MSQSPNSESNINIFSQLSNTVVDNKINSSTIERVLKRSASIEIGSEAKTAMIENTSDEKQVTNIVSKAMDKPKFISARTMISSAPTNSETIPEIPDEELLAMALEFEKKHPQ